MMKLNFAERLEGYRILASYKIYPTDTQMIFMLYLNIGVFVVKNIRKQPYFQFKTKIMGF